MRAGRLSTLAGRMIALLPFNVLRVMGYRHVFGYRIAGARIGWNTVIIVAEARLGACSIGRNNKFVGPMTLEIARGVQIGDRNIFTCGWWTLNDEHRHLKYSRVLRLDEDALVTGDHLFDVSGAVTVGRGSWIAGAGSQFWSHGAGTDQYDITIGERCYLGSAVRFAPGAVIADNTIVALGSVVASVFAEANLMLGGVPAKIIRKDYAWFEHDAATNESAGSA